MSSISLIINKDDETSLLGRQATVLKNAKDWDGAVSCLRSMQESMWDSHVHYSVDTWCRLSLILQQAGRFEESELEFQKLLNDLPKLARKHSFMDDPNVSFGKDTSKKSIYNHIVKVHGMIIREKWELAKTREARRLSKLAKIDRSAK